jgi:predicted nucleic acid-binding protein
MPPIVIDSDILIEVTRGRNLGVITQWRKLMNSEVQLLVSPISIAELWQGIQNREVDALGTLFNSLGCLATDRTTGRLAGEYLSKYRKSNGLELADAFIAAGTVLHRATLWTQNQKHYPMPDVLFHEYA